MGPRRIFTLLPLGTVLTTQKPLQGRVQNGDLGSQLIG